jgi:hypothetical protein
MKSDIKTELKNEVGMYTTSSGEKLTSKEMAETLVQAIEHIQNQAKSTRDAKKIKRLHEKIRNVKLWIALHEDVKQYIK